MAPRANPYSVDTSSLLQAWQRAYPPQLFPRLWSALDELIEAGRLRATIEVYHELQRKNDELAAWAKERKSALFVDIDDKLQTALSSLMAGHPRLVDTKTGKSGADPFVIALAQITPGCLVVSDEQGGSVKSPKIPTVCQALNIECLTILQLIEREGWTF